MPKTGEQLPCPWCGESTSRVIKVQHKFPRNSEPKTQRKKMCLSCLRAFVTIETVQVAEVGQGK